ncbi:LysE family translocator [Enterovibrio sp. ZSDZ42]|uniref:LysE family translocator n=1 Tax=Enterovibrio gelatinilyticus TaxID=2899819 RepID=A0ABT5R4H9_9GAMM|nr:LysE family translocator [Enterovibrio sp. ZSDZ42]MDD1795178.1 LysE family translocator [Enterovibrio sp. ZSDZ42]
MSVDILVMYSIVSFFYIISPGPAVILAMYNGAMNGTRAVMASAFGNIIGLLLLSTLSISGLSAIVLTSSTLFTVLKLVGACYLVFLGVKQLRNSTPLAQPNFDKSEQEHRGNASFFKEGLIVAATNPKPILFFAALFPQFLDTTQSIAPQFVVMTLIFMAFSFLSLSTYGYIANKAKGVISNPNGIRWFTRISGGLFIGMGASLMAVKNQS